MISDFPFKPQRYYFFLEFPNFYLNRVIIHNFYSLCNHLLDKRLLKLCWEGWRRQDLIRFNQYESLFQGDFFDEKVNESDGHTCLLPILAPAIALNHNLKQNEGY